MNNENDVIQDSSPEEIVEEETPIVSEDEKTPTEEDKTVPYERFKRVNDELTKLKKQPIKTVNKALDIEDYIDISASLEGLDQKEKEYLAEQHKYSGKPLKEIRADEDFLLWQSAHRSKVEKENTLKPSSTQSESDLPKSLTEKLRNATMEEKEKLLKEAGLYKEVRPRADRVVIGGFVK